jgi:hypothetical protein
MSEPLTLVVHFIDGSRLSCEFPRQTDDPMRVLRNVRRAMESDKITLELEGQLLLVPTANVKYLSVSPTPDPLPEGVIRGAVLVE